MQATRSHRGLSTARAALSVTWLLARAPTASAPTRWRETLGKSVSTAYNLLASLCDEGVAERLPGGLYHLAPGFRETVAEESDRHNLSGVVDDLLARTHKRAYLAVLRGNQLQVILERGLQGMPKLPGHEPRDPRQRARARAGQGRAGARAGRRARALPRARACKRFTRDTITDPDALRSRAAPRPPRPGSPSIARRSRPTSAASPLRCSTSSAGSWARWASRCPSARSTLNAKP